MPELLPAIAERRARRAFDARPVPQDARELLWRAISLAPSHGNSQPARILVADSHAARERLIAALSDGNRQWAPAAPLLFALVASTSHDIPQTNSDGTVRELLGFNTGIATGNLMAQATAMGLVAHPMAGFDEPKVRAAFEAPEGVRVLAVVAAGYPGSPESLPEDLRAKEMTEQQRLPLDSIVGVDAWKPVLGIPAREQKKPRS